MIIFILIIILIYFIYNINNENFNNTIELKELNFNKINSETIFNNRILLKTTNPNLEIEQNLNSNNKLDSSNCCLVTKNFNGDYYYDYKKMSGDKCNIDLYMLDKNKELLFDGINGWSNNACQAEHDNNYINKLGSCRNNNFECKDFVLEQTCNNYKETTKNSLNNKTYIKWSEKTCEERLEYIPPEIKRTMDYIQ